MTYKTNDWQSMLSEVVTDPEELIQLLDLDRSLLDQTHAAARGFPLKVPRALINRIKKGDISDPILQQVLPLGLELNNQPGYSDDPLKEKTYNPIPGLLHKYHGRVLLTLTSACGVHCRYCFRREFPYEENNPGSKGWSAVLDYIKHDASITEVILSGGDPLVMNDTMLRQFVDKIGEIPHITRLRIHTRMPIVIPQRVTQELVNTLTQTRLNCVVVLHCNHPQELDDTVFTAIQLLKNSNATLLNQSVLLKGVNDCVDILIALSEILFTAGVLPYYLHLLDKVRGAAHFDLPSDCARTLHQGMLERLPGYLVPKLVFEQAGAGSKITVAT